jgi:hypothetical protein
MGNAKNTAYGLLSLDGLGVESLGGSVSALPPDFVEYESMTWTILARPYAYNPNFDYPET